MSSVKEKTIIGSFWSLIERFGYLFIQFISNLVLARLLMPSDFGTIGILLVFITIAEVMIDGGLGTALIQKQNITTVDKSTVFITNILLSVSIYSIIYIVAPYVALYFRNPDLTILLRTIELVIIIDAFCSIQNALLVKSMNFKSIAIVKLLAILISVFISISCALCGMGIWALVIQYILYSIFRAILLWFYSKWRPSLVFSWKSFKCLFGYGYKLLLSTLLADLYNNFQSVLIGRYFTPSDLGNYTQARQLQNIPVGALSRVINTVSLPAYSLLQERKQELIEMFRKNLKAIVFINTPMMMFFAIVAEPLLIFLYSDKWVGAIPYFQFLCVGFGILLIIHQSTLTILKAIGRSDYVLKLEIIKKIIGICLIIVGIKLCGIWGIMGALALNSILELFLNGYFLKKEIGYGSFEQIKDIFPSLLLSILSASCVYFFISILDNMNNLITLMISSLLFVSIYLSAAYLFNLDTFRMYLNIFKSRVLTK